MTEVMADREPTRSKMEWLLDERVLLGIFSTYLVLSLGLLLFLRHASIEAVEAAALPRAIATAEEFARQAQQLRSAPPGARLRQVHAFQDPPAVDVALKAPDGRILLLRQRISAEHLNEAVRFERSYIAISLAGFVVIAALTT